MRAVRRGARTAPGRHRRELLRTRRPLSARQSAGGAHQGDPRCRTDVPQSRRRPHGLRTHPVPRCRHHGQRVRRAAAHPCVRHQAAAVLPAPHGRTELGLRRTDAAPRRRPPDLRSPAAQPGPAGAAARQHRGDGRRLHRADQDGPPRGAVPPARLVLRRDRRAGNGDAARRGRGRGRSAHRHGRLPLRGRHHQPPHPQRAGVLRRRRGLDGLRHEQAGAGQAAGGRVRGEEAA